MSVSESASTIALSSMEGLPGRSQVAELSCLLPGWVRNETRPISAFGIWELNACWFASQCLPIQNAVFEICVSRQT